MSRKSACPFAVAIVFMTVFSGCATMNRVPEFVSASAEPSQLKPGEPVVISAKISDSFSIVRRVEARVLEDKRVKLQLKDDGQAPDQKADDGTWTLEINLPMEAPPGEFNLELHALDAKGNTILVPGPGSESVPMKSTCKLVIAPL